LSEAVQTFGAALVADADIQRMQAAYMQLGKDVQSELVEAGEKAVLEQQAWFWRDLFTAYAPVSVAFLGPGFYVDSTTLEYALDAQGRPYPTHRVRRQ
jgi:hypothetical protein